eukprot:TRINITY_DN7782_c0_g1_i3.p1 TRINITY_DN7782_c0_g1~~TRINITY_DN7782_c0_g1_i3.p1  ORF type:complete len:157 (-),score=35.27 TRINITY_DN7782_c0_g1_i3:53-523(-)
MHAFNFKEEGNNEREDTDTNEKYDLLRKFREEICEGFDPILARVSRYKIEDDVFVYKGLIVIIECYYFILILNRKDEVKSSEKWWISSRISSHANHLKDKAKEIYTICQEIISRLLPAHDDEDIAQEVLKVQVSSYLRALYFAAQKKVRMNKVNGV